MKTAFWCLLLLTGRVDGQTISDEFIGRLVSDLSALQGLPVAANGQRLHDLSSLTSQELTTLKSFVADKSPEQDRIMTRFVEDVAERYGMPVIPWTFSYSLTSSLMGRTLNREALKQLSSSIVTSMDAAMDCRNTQSSIRKSAKFRAAAEVSYDRLLALGVEAADARVVIDSLLKAGLLICNSNVRIIPIPPARRLPRPSN